MKAFRFRKLVSSEFVCDVRKREYTLKAKTYKHNNSTSATNLWRDREKPEIACNQDHKSFFLGTIISALFAFSVLALCVATCKSGNMIIVRYGISEASISMRMVGKQSAGSHLRFFVPGPMIVSASTVPSIVSRFHHKNRLEASNRFRHGLFYSPCGTSSFLSNFERYRGGAQNDFRQQQRWNSSNRKYSYDGPVDERDTRNNKNPLSPLIQSRKRVSKVVRQGAGAMFSLVGFLGSSFASFATDRRSFEDRFLEPIRALRIYLKTSG